MSMRWRTPTTRKLARRTATTSRRDDWEGLRTLYASVHRSFCRPRCRASTRPGALRRPSRRSRGVGLCWPRRLKAPPYWCWTGAASARRTWPGTSPRRLEVLATQPLPDSLGLLYEDLTEHLGFRRSSDEYKVMAMASYGTPRFLDAFRRLVRADRRRRVRSRRRSTWPSSPRARLPDEELTQEHADLAATVQRRLEEVLLDLARWLHARTGDRELVHGRRRRAELRRQLAGWRREGPFDEIWVQPAAGDAGTALGAALHVARRRSATGRADGRRRRSAAAGPTTSCERGCDTRRAGLRRGRTTSPARSPRCWPPTASWPGSRGAASSARGRSGTASLLADPRRAGEPERLNDIKGREQFRPVAPMVLAERAAEIFDGPAAQPVHAVRAPRAARSGGTGSRPSCTSTARRGSRPSTAPTEPLVAALLERVRGAHRAAGASSTPASTRPGGRWSTTRATRWSASGRRRSTCWPWGRTWCGGRCRDAPACSVVIPTVGRPSLRPAAGRARARRGRRRRGRRGRRPAAARPCRSTCRSGTAQVVPGRARGPAAARNAGWRAAGRRGSRSWTTTCCPARLARRAGRGPRRPAGRDVAGSQGRIGCRCRPTGGRPTGSATSPGCERGAGRPPTWPTGARRWCAVGGFDERFPRAYREDADLALRRARRRLATRAAARRRSLHPVRPAPAGSSASDARPATPTTRCMRRAARPRAGGARAGAARGRLPRQLATSAAGRGGRRGWLARRRRRPARRPPAGWPARPSSPGPASPRARGRAGEVATMRGDRDHRPSLAAGWRSRQPAPRRARRPAAAPRRAATRCCFDRDGTLVEDVPYNGDPGAGASRCRARRRR